MFSWLGVIAGLYIISRAKQDLGVIRGLLPGEAGCAVTGHAMFVSRVWALNPGSGTSPRFMKVFTAKRLNRLAQCFSPYALTRFRDQIAMPPVGLCPEGPARIATRSVAGWHLKTHHTTVT